MGGGERKGGGAGCRGWGGGWGGGVRGVYTSVIGDRLLRSYRDYAASAVFCFVCFLLLFLI